MQNKTIQVILDRVSCKSYSDKKVSANKIKQIAECGKNSPSAMNRQICNITVVNTKRNVEKLRELSKKVANRDCFYNAQTMILVHAPREDKFCATDCSCILENMFIAATALKIGSCWIGTYPDPIRMGHLSSILNIPADIEPFCGLALGYPVDKEIFKEVERKAVIHYNTYNA